MKLICAKDLKEGMQIMIGPNAYYVDEVSETRDGQIKAQIGIDGTGTQFFDPNDLVQVED